MAGRSVAWDGDDARIKGFGKVDGFKRSACS
jgi:hypothetical protein